jgi:hypothetical protein
MSHIEGALTTVEFFRTLPPDAIDALSKRCQWL